MTWFLSVLVLPAEPLHILRILLDYIDVALIHFGLAEGDPLFRQFCTGHFHELVLVLLLGHLGEALDQRQRRHGLESLDHQLRTDGDSIGSLGTLATLLYRYHFRLHFAHGNSLGFGHG